MKKILLFIIVVLFVHYSNAQDNKGNFEKKLIGTWNGVIKDDASEKTLKLIITKITFINTGKTMVYGYSTVNEKNKTAFIGTVKLVDGFVDLLLTEKGNKTTNGIFEINTHITDLDNDSGLKELNGSWTQNKTKKVKTVIVNKR